jgi:single-strand DNA-binding protein
MSGSLNKATLIGHLGKDPEVRSFRTADGWRTSPSPPAKAGKTKPPANERNARSGTVSRCSTTGWWAWLKSISRRGAKIYIEGALETRKWTDKAGQEKHTTEIVLRPYSGELLMLDARKGDEPAPDASPNDAPDIAEDTP